jgi:hypothetical protein
MTSLSSVLPGLREIRGPLVAGYVWMLAIWLAVEPCVPSREEADGVIAAFLDLDGAVPVVVTAIGVSVAAYLVGAISEGLLGGTWKQGSSFGGPFFAPNYGASGDQALNEVSKHEAEALSVAFQPTGGLVTALTNPPQRTDIPWTQRVLRETSRQAGQVIGPGVAAQTEDDAVAYTAQTLKGRLETDLDVMRLRLLAREQDMYTYTDRFASESELRFAIVPPLLALDGVLVARWSAVWLLGVIGVAILWRQARERRRESGDVLLEALRIDNTSTPMLDGLRSERALI